MIFRATLLLCLLALPLRAETVLLLPAGARETARIVEPQARHLLPTARFTPDFQPGLMLEGQLVLRAWRVPLEGRAGLPLFQALRAQMPELGFRVLHDCADKLCGGYDFVFRARVLPPPEMEVDLGDFHYLSAVARDDPGHHIGLLVSRDEDSGFVQLAEITPASGDIPALEAPPRVPLAADLEGLEAALGRDGRAVLSGIAFEAGRTALAEGSEAALAAVASLLEKDPGLSLLLVGHSDNSGSLEANIRVSRARAEAVRAALVSGFGVDQARLRAEGAGFLTPLEANLDEEARARNRRVEIVSLPRSQ